jgi:hypothetical protein
MFLVLLKCSSMRVKNLGPDLGNPDPANKKPRRESGVDIFGARNLIRHWLSDYF